MAYFNWYSYCEHIIIILLEECREFLWRRRQEEFFVGFGRSLYILYSSKIHFGELKKIHKVFEHHFGKSFIYL